MKSQGSNSVACDMYTHIQLLKVRIEKNEVGGTCGAWGRGEVCTGF